MEKRCLEIQTFSNENDLKQAYHTSVAKCVELENEIRKLHTEVDCLKKELNEKEQCGKKVYRIVPSIYTLSNNSVELNCHLEYLFNQVVILELDAIILKWFSRRIAWMLLLSLWKKLFINVVNQCQIRFS